MKGSVETLRSSKRRSPERSMVTVRHPRVSLCYSGSSSSMGSSSGLVHTKTHKQVFKPYFLQTTCILHCNYDLHASKSSHS